ncbi:thioredoxin family protein [Cellulophaga omnivescoria]|uniref:thioredoxin family protein n=1 Tax=Cellulophaga omnivescoria TaxID=1888890 RepID=UPI0022F1167A|nr:thioredoxin family protein [Cellulophaga omnivescoria]WBU87908.1 thioredoxin family protein [Cellulophaga omnivescoria]
MRKTLLITTLLLSFNGFCQSTQDCEKILKKEINLIPKDTVNLKRFVEDFSLLKNCGLDDGDIEVFSNGPVLGTILVELSSNKESDAKLTFQNLYDKVLQFKESEAYELTKTTILVSNELAKRPANIHNWNQDKILLEKLEVPSVFIDEFHNYLKEHSNPEKTYKQVFADFQEIKKSKKSETKPTEKEYDGIFKNAGNVDYDDLLNESIEFKKPLLLYFTGYASVNARKIEHYVLSDKTITEKLKNEFHFVNLYVDDRISLPENERIKSKTNGEFLKYVGQKHSELQKTKFNSNYQPYFVIIDKNGNIIKEQGYTTDIKIFEEFLTINE